MSTDYQPRNIGVVQVVEVDEEPEPPTANIAAISEVLVPSFGEGFPAQLVEGSSEVLVPGFGFGLVVQPLEGVSEVLLPVCSLVAPVGHPHSVSEAKDAGLGFEDVVIARPGSVFGVSELLNPSPSLSGDVGLASEVSEVLPTGGRVETSLPLSEGVSEVPEPALVGLPEPEPGDGVGMFKRLIGSRLFGD